MSVVVSQKILDVIEGLQLSQGGTVITIERDTFESILGGAVEDAVDVLRAEMAELQSRFDQYKQEAARSVAAERQIADVARLEQALVLKSAQAGWSTARILACRFGVRSAECNAIEALAMLDNSEAK